jgi:hypothetical protein
MNTPALAVRTVSAALLGVVALVGMIHGKPDNRPASPVVAASAVKPITAQHVATTSPIVTLPTISVRPSREETAEAYRTEAVDVNVESAQFAGGVMLPVSDRTTASLPAFRLPYYSFGTALHRVSKD